MLATVKSHLAGEMPVKRVFLYDMLLVGTLVNIATGFTTLAAVALGASSSVATAIFLSPQPYNIFLCLSVWRSASRDVSGWSEIARIGTVIWYPLMFVV